MPTVSEIMIYPVKSCKGLSTSRALLTPSGFSYDRRWMVVRADSGKFISLRQTSKLRLIEVSLPPEALVNEPLPRDAALQLNAPGMAPIRVPLAPEQSSTPLKDVKVWDWSGKAADEGDAVAAWLSEFMGTGCRLVRYLGAGAGVADVVRPTDKQFTYSQEEVAPPEGATEIAFVDGYPLLLATEEALADLNNQLDAPVPMARFRPNITFSASGPPWSDDAWGVLSFPAGPMVELVKPCSRCKVPSIDLETGEAGDEPNKKLKEFRSGTSLGWAAARKSFTHEIFFGWNGAPLRLGLISVGDNVTINQQRVWK